MPNTIVNTLTIMGDPYHVSRVREAIQDRKIVFSFEKILELYNVVSPPGQLTPADEHIRAEWARTSRQLRGSLTLETDGVLSYEIETAWVYPLPPAMALARVFPIQIVMSSTAWEWSEADGTTPIYYFYIADRDVQRRWTEHDHWEVRKPARWEALWRQLRYPKPDSPVAEKFPKSSERDDIPF